MSQSLPSPGWTCARDGTVYPSRAHFEQKITAALAETATLTRTEEVQRWLEDNLADLIWQTDSLRGVRTDYMIGKVRIERWEFNKMLEITNTGPIAGWEVLIRIDHTGRLPDAAITRAIARLGGMTYRTNHGAGQSTVRIGLTTTRWLALATMQMIFGEILTPDEFG